MPVIVVVGLPGSGKSGLLDELARGGYTLFEDITRDWNGDLPRARSHAREGRNVAITDLMFCYESWRSRLEHELALPVQWIFFENNPWQCAKNCLYRFMFQKPHRPLRFEVVMIRKLSLVYKPYGEIRPVVRADAQIPSQDVCA
jgi:hypothetical protein